uniref:Uncharacterized protein n=1 Tax=Leersia perrieri TaxID=77586 RepID=A0A0D9XUJ4_9ORYZ
MVNPTPTPVTKRAGHEQRVRHHERVAPAGGKDGREYEHVHRSEQHLDLLVGFCERKLRDNISTVPYEEPPKLEELTKEKKTKKILVESVVDGSDLDMVLSYEPDELSYFIESTHEWMLQEQEKYRRQIENFGYAFIHYPKKVILLDDNEEGEYITDDEGRDDDVEKKDATFTEEKNDS